MNLSRRLLASLCFVGLSLGLSAKPVFPLYSPYFGVEHAFTEEDLRRIAENFDFIYGHAAPTPEQMTMARGLNPALRFLRYSGNWAVSAGSAEKELRGRILYYHAATLAADLTPEATSLALAAPSDTRALLFKPSTAEGEFTENSQRYVTWLRIGDEFMKITGWDAATAKLTVQRGFAGTTATAHARGDRAFHPAYSSVPGQGRGRVSYLYDPAYPDRWESILQGWEKFTTTGGGDGIWIDILMASTLGDSDVGGTRLRGVNAESGPGDLFVWDFGHDRSYRRADFREKTEAQLRVIREKYQAQTGRAPLVYGNNMYWVEFQPDGGETWRYMTGTAEKSAVVAGMCIEDFMGGYDAELWSRYSRGGEVMPPPKASLGPQTYRQWRHNAGMFAWCSQQGLPAIPLILNAGMKTAIFEKLDRATRHDWERWAYASYLLGLEAKDGVVRTKLGVPMFYHDETGRRFVDLDPMYAWPIGLPTETKPADRFDDYQIAGSGVYRRHYTGGQTLVNPTTEAQTVQLGEKLWQPETAQWIEQLTLPPQTGFVLLKQKL